MMIRLKAVSEVNEVNDSVCLLFDSRERPGNNQYTASFSQFEQVLHQCANKVAIVVQNKVADRRLRLAECEFWHFVQCDSGAENNRKSDP